MKYPNKELFILDLANNHQGDVDHARRIIKEIKNTVNWEGLKVAIKIQLRNLEQAASPFIHPDYREDKVNKNIDRFLSTRLSTWGYWEILATARENGFLTMATPFDEVSVQTALTLNVDYLKVASCSAQDWPLLDKISVAGKPTIISTGGLSLRQIDELVSYFRDKGTDFSLHHCVSIYPCENQTLNLARIAKIKERHPDIDVGWSTHERPENTGTIGIAYALGATMFERHVGIETEEYKLNDYSSTPEQIDEWVEALRQARMMIYGGHAIQNLNSLKRGIYLKKDIGEFEIIEERDVFYAMPLIELQAEAGSVSFPTTSQAVLKGAEPLMKGQYHIVQNESAQIKTGINIARTLLARAKINLPASFEAEYSHHYGVEHFLKTGAIMITIFNRAYCKKYIIQLPGQSHPEHYHPIKEESFQLLAGDIRITLDGKSIIMSPGETITVHPGVWHGFESSFGGVLEEVSTTLYPEDSVYKDRSILLNFNRKTKTGNWGRF